MIHTSIPYYEYRNDNFNDERKKKVEIVVLLVYTGESFLLLYEN